MTIGYIDDVTILTRGNSFEESNQKISNIMNDKEGALKWAAESNCEFEIDKFALMGFSTQTIPRPFEPRKRRPVPRFQIKVGGHTFKPTKSTKFLGVIINQSLSWAEQTAAALKKGNDWVMKCKRIAKPTKGLPAKVA